MEKNLIKRCTAELMGSFFLVFIGCGAVIMRELNPQVLPLSMIPFAFGGTVAIMVYVFGHISGTHINPAVTLAFFVDKQIKFKDMLAYMGVQCLGCFLASLFHLWIFGVGGHSFGVTKPVLLAWPAFLVELVLSFLLVLVVVATTSKRAFNMMAGACIGATIILAAVVGGNLSGASMNPARSFGPALISLDFGSLWLYISAPLMGGVLAVLSYNFVSSKKNNKVFFKT